MTDDSSESGSSASQRATTIVKILQRPSDRVLATAIYRPHLHSRHGPVANLYAQRMDEVDPRVAMAPGQRFYDDAVLLWAIKDIWRQRVRRLYELDEDLGQMTHSAIQSMERCYLAGVILNPKPREQDLITCRKYAVCPFCRYRMGLKLIDEYSAMAADYRHIGVVSLYYPMDEEGMVDQTLANMRKLIDRICKHNRSWDKDVVITVPAWGRKSKRWYYRMTILAFSLKPDVFRPPEELAQTIDWKPVPPVGGTMWMVKENTRSLMLRLVAQALEYSPGLLFESLPPEKFASMARTTESFRVKKHG